MLEITFIIFFAAAILGISIGGAHEIRSEFAKMWEDHELELRKIDQDYRERAYELYLRSNPDIKMRRSA